VKITKFNHFSNYTPVKLIEPINENIDGGTHITASFNVVEWTVEDIDGIG
jgi:hypothetical protein